MTTKKMTMPEMEATYNKYRLHNSWTLKPKFQKQFVHLGTFIETGSLHGGGIEQALKLGFKKVLSIELDSQKYTNCYTRFGTDSRVKLWHGDSKKLFKHMMIEVSKPALVFLDSHGPEDSPLIEELLVLGDNRIPHVIIIDDTDYIMKNQFWGRFIKKAALYRALARLSRYDLKVVNSLDRQNAQWILTPVRT